MSQLKDLTPEEIEKGHTEIARAYILAMLDLMFLSGQEEVNFMKKTLETPDGGVYLLQVQHISGPKINLKTLYSKKSK